MAMHKRRSLIDLIGREIEHHRLRSDADLTTVDLGASGAMHPHFGEPTDAGAEVHSGMQWKWPFDRGA